MGHSICPPAHIRKTSVNLRRLSPDEVEFEVLDAFQDRMFSQRRHWLEFIQSFTDAEIVLVEIEHNGSAIGYFTGLMFRRFGVPILGSPFPGWTTPFMGFNLLPRFPRVSMLEPLERWAFRELGCLHLEVRDRHLLAEDAMGWSVSPTSYAGYLSDLSASEDQIFSRMASPCRRAIRKGQKNGLIAEAALPNDFAEEYYEQVADVFARQGLRPTYSLDRVQNLINYVYPSGDLLLARVREPGGRTVAAGIFPGFGSLSYYWGSGSLGRYQFLRPNELLHWFALRYWKNRGVREHEWGGGGAYKAKYGPTPFNAPFFCKSRYKVIQYARNTAERAYYFPREFHRRLYRSEVLSRLVDKLFAYPVGFDALLGVC